MTNAALDSTRPVFSGDDKRLGNQGSGQQQFKERLFATFRGRDLWRAMEVKFEGRANSILIPIYDGKQAPWPGTPGGSLQAVADAAVAAGAKSIAIDGTGLAPLEAGMGFSLPKGRLIRNVQLRPQGACLARKMRLPHRRATMNFSRFWDSQKLVEAAGARRPATVKEGGFSAVWPCYRGWREVWPHRISPAPPTRSGYELPVATLQELKIRQYRSVCLPTFHWKSGYF